MKQLLMDDTKSTRCDLALMPPVVLVVEDNEDDALLIQRAAARLPYPVDVRIANSLADGVKLVDQACMVDVKLVLVDLNVAGTRSFEFISYAHQEGMRLNVPVVVLTASDSPVDAALCMKIGANSIVHKHIDYDRAMDDLSLLLNYWLRLHVRPGT